MSNAVIPHGLGNKIGVVGLVVAEIVVVQQTLLNTAAIERPVSQGTLGFLAPVRNWSVLVPALLGVEVKTDRDIVDVHESLPRWTDQEETSVEWRVGACTANKVEVGVEEVVAVLVEDNVRVEEKNHVVLDKLEHTNLGTIDGSSKTIEGLWVMWQSSTKAANWNDNNVVLLEELLVLSVNLAIDKSNNVVLAASAADALSSNKEADQIVVASGRDG